LSTQQGLANVQAMARGKGVIAGVVASWVKALSEPTLQAAAERIRPPSPAQKEEVGADPTGRPENMPPAVLADRAAVALGHRGLSPSQRVRVQHVIHYAVGAGLGVYQAQRSDSIASAPERDRRRGLAPLMLLNRNWIQGGAG